MSCMVSVVIPTHKRGLSFVKRAVDSVVNQTYDNIEIIIVDDSSADYEGRTVIADYVKSLKFSGNVIYIENEKPVGGAVARNNGISAAHGEYITFLDDDDEYMPDKIKNQVSFMIESGCDMSFTDLVICNQSGKVIDYREYPDLSDFSNDNLLHYHLIKHLCGTPTFMFRIDKIREIGGFVDVKMGQEFHMMLRAIESGLKIGYCKTCDVRVYRHKSGGISQGKNKIEGENSLFEYKKSYFNVLSEDEIKYIKFRHYAVMVVAYLRNANVFAAAGMGIAAFCSSPSTFFKEVFGFFAKIVRHKNDVYVPEEGTEKVPDTVVK